MTIPSKRERTERLSAYLDGELDKVQAREVEELLSNDPGARKELEELRRLKALLASKKPIPSTLGFWTRLSTSLVRRKAEEENLFPVPRKYLPALATGVAVLVMIAVVFLFSERESVVQYVSQQTERVQQVVGENVLKGSILPLFSNLDKNQALQFAMFGTLPLDPKAETELRVNEDSTKWYTINVDKKGATRTPAVTVKEFVEEVKPNPRQLQIIDSLLDLGRLKIEGSVFVAEDRAMAVHPELSRLNKIMLSGIAASLEPEQRTRMNRFLQQRRAPYTLTGGARTPESMDRILRTMSFPQHEDRFVVVTPETVVIEGLKLDVDSLRRHAYRVDEARHSVSVHVDGLMRRIAEREPVGVQKVRRPSTNVRVFGDSDVFSIQIESNWDGMPDAGPERWIRPRFPRSSGTARDRRVGGSFQFGFSGNDSSFFFNINLDSLMMQMMKDAQGAGIEFFKGDPRGRQRTVDFGRMRQMLDSAMLAKKKPSPKLDSLMREMEKRARLQREQDLPNQEQY